MQGQVWRHVSGTLRRDTPASVHQLLAPPHFEERSSLHCLEHDGLMSSFMDTVLIMSENSKIFTDTLSPPNKENCKNRKVGKLQERERAIDETEILSMSNMY